MSVFKDTMCGMWRAEIGAEISPYCGTREEAEEAEAMLEDGMIWRDGGWITAVVCDLCGESGPYTDNILTEEGAFVGECCHGQLRAVHCDKQGETWYYVS